MGLIRYFDNYNRLSPFFAANNLVSSNISELSKSLFFGVVKVHLQEGILPNSARL